MNDLLKQALELAALAQIAQHDKELELAPLMQAYATVSIAQTIAEIGGDLAAIRGSLESIANSQESAAADAERGRPAERLEVIPNPQRWTRSRTRSSAPHRSCGLAQEMHAPMPQFSPQEMHPCRHPAPIRPPAYSHGSPTTAHFARPAATVARC